MEKTMLQEEEIKKLQGLKEKYQNIIFQIGQITIQLDQLKMNKEILQNQYLNIQKEEAELVESLNKKYGEGIIDPKDWTFVSNKK